MIFLSDFFRIFYRFSWFIRVNPICFSIIKSFLDFFFSIIFFSYTWWRPWFISFSWDWFFRKTRTYWFKLFIDLERRIKEI